MNNVPRETNNQNPSIEGFSGKKILDLKDYFLTQEDFSIYKDEKTGVLFTYPQPLDKLDEYYKSENYISHTDSKKSIIDKVYQVAKNFNLKKKKELIQKVTKGKKILDYGCGAGDFLLYMKQHGYKVTGMEPNEKALNISQKKLGKEHVINKELKHINEKFDIITLWHVLEHIPNLNEIVSELKNHLNKDGVLIIAVPNNESYDAKHYKKYWAAYDVPRHLWHFNPKSFKNFITNFGMNIELETPMLLDSFYVSLLSEKHKKSNFKYLKAIYRGIISNNKAKKDGNYSSVIYTVKENKF